MKSFLHSNKPIITTMLKSDNTDDIISEIKRSISEGAEAFGLQIETMKNECRTEKNYKKIISAMEGRAAYVTNYRRNNVSPAPKTDDELAEELLTVLRCGAVLIDIRGDMFSPCDEEITYDSAAVVRQKEMIKTIHSMGGEVLMSSHVLKFLPKENILKIALSHSERGADISKIVTSADNEEELLNNFETLFILKKELKIPSLFLCNGTFCRPHRLIGPLLGSALFLTTENKFSCNNSTQPKNKTAVEILKNVYSVMED